LDEQGKLDKLRVVEVSVARDGRPEGDVAKPVVEEFKPQYPAQATAMNRELCQVLLALDPADAVGKTVKLLTSTKVQEDQVFYVLSLRTIKDGWTPESRKAYFTWWTDKAAKREHPATVVKWFEEAGIAYNDGSSFARFLGNFHTDAVKTLTPEETAALQPLLASYAPPGPRPAKKPAKKHEFVKAWKMTDLEPLLSQTQRGRNYNQGKDAYEVAQCLQCHKFGNDGGAVGPDLTAVSSRFKPRDILESIVEPSRVISEQFQNTVIETKDGDTLDGRIVEEDANRVVLQANPLLPEKQTIKKSDIKDRRASKLSPMPEGLINVLSKDEVLDLLAYIESGGRKDSPAFAK
jgi:putative heme-binding domain-containing protein